MVTRHSWWFEVHFVHFVSFVVRFCIWIDHEAAKYTKLTQVHKVPFVI